MVFVQTCVFICLHIAVYVNIQGYMSQDSLLVERWTRDQKVVSLNPGRSGRRIFFSS